MFFDYHIHTNFSADSRMTFEEVCARSLVLGLEEICITDHYDPDYPHPDLTFEIDFPNYLAALERVQKEFAGKLRIKKGMELGLQPHIVNECAALVSDELDFVIGSFHLIQRKDLYVGDFFKGYTQWEAYREYLKEVLVTLQNYQRYSVVGHLDVVRRYGDYIVVPDLMDDADCRDLIDEILKTVIANGKGLEVNTSGYYIAAGHDPMPTRGVLKRYCELGGEILTTGSDSHSTVQLGYKFRETHVMLKELGFKYLTTFEKMQPKYHVIG